MGLTMKERKAVTAVMRGRDHRMSKKQKGGLLDGRIALNGHNPLDGGWVLRGPRPPPGGGAGGGRRRLNVRGRSGTKPGTLLKQQIPIRTFAEWDQTQPGFVEIDLVGHDGGFAQGDYCQTLDVTDVASGWTETEAVLNKAQVWVFEALQHVRARLPFALKGIDSDNGSEVINNHPLRYTRPERIVF